MWLTADGDPVLDHDGIVKTGLRKRPISEVMRRDLPEHIPGLDDLYAVCGTSFELSLDVKDPTAHARVVAVARATGGDALEKLWLCDPEWTRLAALRRELADVKLVDSTRLKRLTNGPERHASQLADAGIDCINMHHTDWNKGLVTLFNRFGLRTFGWDAQFERILYQLVLIGVDGLYSDHVDRMMSIVASE